MLTEPPSDIYFLLKSPYIPPQLSHSTSGSVRLLLAMAAENPHLELDPKYDHYPNKHSGHLGHTMPEQDAQVFQLRMMLEAAGHKERLDTLTLVCTPARCSFAGDNS